jgi:hypothetical protein
VVTETELNIRKLNRVLPCVEAALLLVAPLHMVVVGHLLRGWGVVHLGWPAGDEQVETTKGEGLSSHLILFISWKGVVDGIYRPDYPRKKKLRGILLYCSVVCAYRRLSLFCSHLCHELVHGRNERDGAWLTVGLDAPTCQRLFAESMSSFCCPTTKPRVQRMDFTQMSLHF